MPRGSRVDACLVQPDAGLGRRCFATSDVAARSAILHESLRLCNDTNGTNAAALVDDAKAKLVCKCASSALGRFTHRRPADCEGLATPVYQFVVAGHAAVVFSIRETAETQPLASKE